VYNDAPYQAEEQDGLDNNSASGHRQKFRARNAASLTESGERSLADGTLIQLRVVRVFVNNARPVSCPHRRKGNPIMKQPKPRRVVTKTTSYSGRTKVPTTSRPATSRTLVGLKSTERVDSKWAWHYRVLLKKRDRLLKERGQQLREAAEPLEPHSMNIADSATDEFDHDLALWRLSVDQDVLYEVEQAIRRIRAGTYGICEESGQPIPAERLRAIPWTRFCEEVEARLEKTGLVKQPRLGAVASVRGVGDRTIEGSEIPGSEEQGEVIPNDEDLGRVFTPRDKHLHPGSVKGRRTRRAAGTE
jgi:RNA polymerase-binding transcription factor DksA